jgi:5-formyltetrahydrofolate cyclo-ligase
MTKNALRDKYKALRQRLSTQDLDELSLQIANQSLDLNIWDFKYYHLFLSITEKKEINTEYILQIIFGYDAQVVVPKVNGTQLDHFLLTDSTRLKLNKWNIPEPVDGIPIPPESLDVVFIPLLAFDKLGNRIGYGKGYYDRFLASCRPDIIKVGLSFFPPEDKILDVSSHDIPLDFAATPQKIYEF